MVGDTRIELVTPSMSTKCSTAELIAHETDVNTMPLTKRSAEIRASGAVYKRSRAGVQGLLIHIFFSL